VAKINSIKNDFISLEKRHGETWLGMIGFLGPLKGIVSFSGSLLDEKQTCLEQMKLVIVGGGPRDGSPSSALQTIRDIRVTCLHE